MDEMENLTKQELKEKVKSYGFAVLELALYLDTHPNDEKALRLHNEYARDYREVFDLYQKLYGPLNIGCPCNKWRWLEEPWPWENRNGGDC